MFQVDWRQPWVQPLECLGAPLLARWREYLQQKPPSTCEERLHEVLNEAKQSKALLPDFSFVAQSQKPQEVSYEEFIFDTHQIPTRDNAHDFFNALTWFTCPQTKKALNGLQAQEIKRQGVGDRRGKLRDALTLFDENVMCIRCSDELWQAVCEQEWVKLFWDFKQEWSTVELHVFGHALLEKLLNPYKAITAHVVRVDSPSKMQGCKSSEHPWDAMLQAHVLDLPRRLALSSEKPYQVMPVMGIKGWWNEPSSRAFYDDRAVFRTKGVRAKSF